jgi:hypothetical protein
MLPDVSYSCKTWSVILRKDHSPRIFENRALREIFEPEVRERHKAAENFIVRNFIIFTAP